MRPAAVWWLLMVSVAVCGARDLGYGPKRRKYVQIVLWGGFQIESYVGNPQQSWTWMSLSTKISEIAVIDSKCGVRDSGCPAYCSDPAIADLYCDKMCHPLVGPSSTFTCVSPYSRYYANESIGTELIEYRGWNKRVPGLRPLFGNIYRDRAKIMVRRMSRPLKDYAKFAIFNVTFVGALMFDRRLIRSGSALFGLAPGPNSAVVEFIRGLNLHRSLMSLSIRRSADFIRHPPDIYSSFLTLGALDMYRCVDWKWMTTFTADDFLLLMPTIDFMGVELHDIQVTFDLHDSAFFIPQPLADYLTEKGVIRRHSRLSTYTIYSYDCQSNRPIRFLDADGQSFMEFDNQTLVIQYEQYLVECVMIMAVDSSDPNTQPRVQYPILNLGRPFLDSHCLGFDYESSRIGVARRRQWSHPFYDYQHNVEDKGSVMESPAQRAFFERNGDG